MLTTKSTLNRLLNSPEKRFILSMGFQTALQFPTVIKGCLFMGEFIAFFPVKSFGLIREPGLRKSIPTACIDGCFKPLLLGKVWLKSSVTDD